MISKVIEGHHLNLDLRTYGQLLSLFKIHGAVTFSKSVIRFFENMILI